MMLSQVNNFLKNNKKIMYYLGFFAVMYVALGDSVFASDISNPSTQLSKTEETVNMLIGFLNYAFKFFSIVLGVLTNFVGLFLNPSWTNGTVFGLQVQLKELWILVSNVVYFIFAILLVVIAFMNILGKGDQWELKQALPKFIIGVLIVPFSWFLVQFIISISSILTATVLAIPYDVLSKSDIKEKLGQVEICTHVYISDNDDVSDLKDGCVPNKTKTADEIMTGDTAFGILHIYTYGIFAVDQHKDLYKEDVATTARTISGLSFKKVVDAILVVVYGILVVTLALALIVRGIWLWVYMIFSPIFGLLYFFGKGKDNNFMDGKFSLTEFIALAFVPVYVAGALAFGLLFIFVAGHGSIQPGTELIFNTNVTDKYVEDSTAIKLLDTFTVEMGGTLGNSASEVKTIGNVLDNFKGALGTFIVQLFGLVVLWATVITAMSQSKITKTVVDPIAQVGKSIGDLAVKAPQYTPIFGGMSAQGLSKVAQMPAAALSTRAATKAGKFQDPINKMFGANILNPGDVEKFNKSLISLNKNNLGDYTTQLKKFANEVGTGSTQFRNAYGQYVDKLAEENIITGDQAEAAKSYQGQRLSTEGAKIMLMDNGYVGLGSISADEADKYRSAAMNPGAEHKTVDDKEGDLNVKFEDRDNLKEKGVNVSGKIKLYVDKDNDGKETGRVIIGEHDGKAGDMTFEKYAALQEITDPKIFLRNMAEPDKDQLRNLYTNLGLSQSDMKDVMSEMFPNLNNRSEFDKQLVDIESKKEGASDDDLRAIDLEIRQLQRTWENRNDIDYIIDNLR